MYPELQASDHRVIPIGTDETVFKPSDRDPGIPEGSVLWVGSGNRVKGFDLACRLAEASGRPWVFVMKDDTTVEIGALVLRRIPQRSLAGIASSCAVGICTSLRETQHLAGIEMGMCGLPLVTTGVGAYYEREPGPWGRVTSGDWIGDIEAASSLGRDEVARYWRSEGFGLEVCMEAWRNNVAMMETADVFR
jgi:glycosyltransferase involved in cell wall biosynthesis